MKRALVAVAALVAFGAFAQEAMIARNGEDSVRLTKDACTNADVLKRLKDEYKDQFHAAHVHTDGTDWEACWIGYGDSVYFFYSDGDKGLIPKADFKPDGA